MQPANKTSMQCLSGFFENKIDCLMSSLSTAGVTGKMSTQTLGEDDNFGTELSQQAILRVLGSERRNRVLAGLYMGRSDTTLNVRQAALHVWKVVVAHTPKTLREILPTLFQLLLGCLASKSYDKRQVGGCVVTGFILILENSGM